MKSDWLKPNRSTVIWQAISFTPFSMQAARSSATSATPLSLMVRLIRAVARDSNPGAIACTAFGMFQSMLRNHCGPNGIFIGMPGLPSGLTLSVERSRRSRFRP